MIRVKDGLLLAAAKLRIRRVRMMVTVVICSLLFALLVFLALLFAGIIQSVQSFGKEGLGGRLIVQGMPIIDNAYDQKQLVDELRPAQNDLIKQKKAAAKELGIEYDEKSDASLPISESDMGGGYKESFLNTESPIAEEALAEQQSANKEVTFSAFQDFAKQHGANATYRSTQGGMFSGMMGPVPAGAPQTSLSFIVNGKEKGVSSKTDGEPTGFETITQLGWNRFDDDLLKPFLIPGQNAALGKDGSVPVIAPMSAVEEILGLKKLSANASSKERLARLEKVRRDIAGRTVQICFRNSASQDLLNQAVQDKALVAKNKNNKDFVAPALQYNVPSAPCGAVTIKQDKRSAEEIKLAKNQETFDKRFGLFEAPKQDMVTLRVVGINADLPGFTSGFSVRDIISSLLQSSLGFGWASPSGAVAQNPTVLAYMGGDMDDLQPGIAQYYAEFPSLDSAKKFVDQACSVKQTFMYNPNKQDPRVADCHGQGRYFDLSPFGSNAGAIEDLKRNIWNVLRYVVAVLVVISALIMMGIVGKIIADGRRETAVFRALGATRTSISQIYLTYAVMLALLVGACALALGTLVAMWLQGKYGSDVSVAAVIAYNAGDIHKQFMLIGFNPRYLGVIIALVIATALASAIIPLLTNMRRNPIRDMRDEG